MMADTAQLYALLEPVQQSEAPVVSALPAFIAQLERVVSLKDVELFLPIHPMRAAGTGGGESWIIRSSKTYADLAAVESRILTLGEEEVHLDQPVSSKSRCRSGPISFAGKEAGPGECVVSFFFTDDQKRLLICLVAVADSDMSQPLAREQIYAILQPVLGSLHSAIAEKILSAGYRRRIPFFNAILDLNFAEPACAITQIAEAWREVTGCEWVWIWLHNQDAGQWEYLGGDANASRNYPPRSAFRVADHGVCQYTALSGRPELMVRPGEWKKVLEGNVFEVACVEDLKAKGCEIVDCIPLMPPKSGVLSTDERDNVPLRASICLHFKSSSKPVHHTGTTLGLMGRLTAQALKRLFEHERHATLEAINRIATDVLATYRYKPREAWEEFSKRIVHLICKRIGTQYASVFYRNWSDSSVSCAASTGLFRKGKAVSKQLLTEVKVDRGTGLTGFVYLSGVPVVHTIDSAMKLNDDFTELPPPLQPEKVASAVYPIVLKPTSGVSRVCGVVRCCAATVRFPNGITQEKNLDSFQLGLLAFVCDQVAATYETLLSYREREHSVSATKHDLYAPLSFIRDILNRVSPPFESADRNRSTVASEQQLLAFVKNTIEALESVLTLEKDFLPSDHAVRLQNSAAQWIRSCSSHAMNSAALLRECFLQIEELRVAVAGKSTEMSAQALRSARASLSQLEKLFKALSQKYASRAYGITQDVCFITAHDVTNISDTITQATGLVKRLDLTLTDVRPFQPSETHLGSEILERLRNSMISWAREAHHVNIEFNLELFRAKIPPLYVDKHTIERTISNVLTNAVKYSLRNTVVRIVGRNLADGYYLDFWNDGIGIDESERELIFKEGYRSQKAIEVASGDGFGLGIARDIMLRHGGDVIITSLHQPTIISLKFPKSSREPALVTQPGITSGKSA